MGLEFVSPLQYDSMHTDDVIRSLQELFSATGMLPKGVLQQLRQDMDRWREVVLHRIGFDIAPRSSESYEQGSIDASGRSDVPDTTVHFNEEQGVAHV